jgi:hypothetical protein
MEGWVNVLGVKGGERRRRRGGGKEGGGGGLDESKGEKDEGNNQCDIDTLLVRDFSNSSTAFADMKVVLEKTE